MGCTGIRVIADDGTVVYGRTMEWGAFDLHSRVAIVSKGHEFTGLTPEGANGRSWKAQYGFIGLDMLGKDVFGDGMNETGLAIGLFYHPDFAEYPAYDPAHREDTISAVDLVAFVLSNSSSVDEAIAGLSKVDVVPVVEEAIGIPVQAHWMITEPSGKSVIVEFANGDMRVFDNPLGVITNAPSYDWHMTNLRNYVNLSGVAVPTKSIEQMDFKPVGAGSGMIGLPGDFTPPSRFIRAVAWTQTARATPTANETFYEVFRILDNFNLPLGAAEGSDESSHNLEGMRSSTIWTTAWNLDEKVLYYHTQHNRRVRAVRLKGLDFSQPEIHHVPLDREPLQDIEDVTPTS